MKSKRMMLSALLAGTIFSAGVLAEETGWGDVAGDQQTDAWGAEQSDSQAEPDAGGQGDKRPEKETTASATEAGKVTCGEDDPRYANLVGVLKEVKAGREIEPLQTSFSTYVGMNPKIRDLLGDNIYISSPDCSEQYIFEGVLTGQIRIPFSKQWNAINDALRTQDQELLTFIVNNTKAAPASAEYIMSLTQFAAINDRKLQKLYSVTDPSKKNKEDPRKPLLLELFVQLGGAIQDNEAGRMLYVASSNSVTHDVEGIYIGNDGGFYSADIEDGIISEPDNYVASLLTATGLRAQVKKHSEAQEAAAAK